MAVLLMVPIVLAGCRDVDQALELRERVRDRLGWAGTTVRIEVPGGYVEIELTDPEDEAATPDRSSALRVARLATSVHQQAGDSDSIAVTFLSDRSEGADPVRAEVKHRYVFPTDSL